VASGWNVPDHRRKLLQLIGRWILWGPDFQDQVAKEEQEALLVDRRRPTYRGWMHVGPELRGVRFVRAAGVTELPEYDPNLLSPVGILISERVRHTRLGENLRPPFVTLNLDWGVGRFPSPKLSGEILLEFALRRQTGYGGHGGRKKQQEDKAILSHPRLY